MEEKEINDVYAIPANYTDSGKILGGLLSPRNALETVILAVLLGYIEFTLIPMSDIVRVVVMALTLIPISIVSLMGIDGDSLFQYLGHIFKYLKARRKLHFKRVEIDYE